MSLDKELLDAITNACVEESQSSEVINKLLSWLNELSEVEMSVEDKKLRFQLLMQSLNVGASK